MLVLTRKKGESIMIGDQIELVVLAVEGDTVKVGINAPRDIDVFRKEVFDAIQQSNKEATQNTLSVKDLTDMFQKNAKNEEK